MVTKIHRNHLRFDLNGSGIEIAHGLRGQALLEELKTEFEERVAAEAAAKAEADAAKAEGEATAWARAAWEGW